MKTGKERLHLVLMSLSESSVFSFLKLCACVPPPWRGLCAFMKKLLILMVRTYQVLVSPLFGKCCRFYPSCSAYCIAAIEKHGCINGLWLGILRMCKCHPFHPGGVDFVS